MRRRSATSRRTQRATRDAASRQRWQARWREAHWAALAGLALIALALGYIGFDRHHASDGYGVGDLLIRSIQLFVLESSAVDPPAPWQLEVARVLAPTVAVYAAIAAAVALFRDQVRMAKVRLLYRDHTVIAGLGRKGLPLANALRAAGWRPVVIESDERNTALPGARERGLTVIVGDARKEELLARAQVGRARHLVALCGNDGDNLDVGFTAASLERRRAYPLRCLLHVEDTDLRRMLKSAEVGAGRSPLRLEFFSLWETGARLLLDHHPPFPEEVPGGGHVVVVGFEEFGASVLLHSVRLWRDREDGGELRVSVVDPDARSRVEDLVEAQPELRGACTLAPVEVDVGAIARGDLPLEGPEPTAVYVRLESEAHGLAAALAIARDARAARARVVLAVDDEETGAATALEGLPPTGADLHAFGILRRVLGPELLERGTYEVLARAMHEEYLRIELAKGPSTSENSSLVPWARLPETLKESNRRFAHGVGEKLEAGGCTILPAPLADPRRARLPLDRNQVEELAHMEHDRWCNDLRRDGWRVTDGRKDPHRKLHPDLVGWEQLSEADREKDRDAIRALPAILARAGFEMRQVDRAPSAADRGQRPT